MKKTVSGLLAFTCLSSSALVERVYFRGYGLFVALWFALVCCPPCHWVWGPGGWLFQRGVIDLAGGPDAHPPEQTGTASALTLTITNALPWANCRTGVRLP